MSCVFDQLESLCDDGHLDVLDMDAKLIKRSAALKAPSVIKLLNMSLSSGVPPNDWKLAKSNFRLILIIGCISMIAQREVQSQLMSHCIKHKLITIGQFAFLKNHSAVGCRHTVINDWYDATNEGEYIMFCFLDVQKCFDCIGHDLLLTKFFIWHKWHSTYMVS